jgi:hypothetical protein
LRSFFAQELVKLDASRQVIEQMRHMADPIRCVRDATASRLHCTFNRKPVHWVVQALLSKMRGGEVNQPQVWPFLNEFPGTEAALPLLANALLLVPSRPIRGHIEVNIDSIIARIEMAGPYTVRIWPHEDPKGFGSWDLLEREAHRAVDALLAELRRAADARYPTRRRPSTFARMEVDIPDLVTHILNGTRPPGPADHKRMQRWARLLEIDYPATDKN